MREAGDPPRKQAPSPAFLTLFRRRLAAFWVLAVALLVFGWTFRPAPIVTERSSRVQTMQNSCPEAPKPEAKSPARKLIGRLRLDNEDSWRAMRAALTTLEEQPKAPLYATIFARCIKFQYPPSSLLALDLLGTLFGSIGVSNPLLNGIAYVLLGVMLAAIARIYLNDLAARGPPLLVDRLAAFAFPLIAYPVLKSIELGQIQTWLNGMLAASLCAYLFGSPRTAGILIGLMATIKPQMGLFLVWALVQREYVLAKAIGVTAGLVSVVALLRYGLGPHLEYLRVLSDISRHGESYFANQSFNGLLLRAMHLGPNVFFDRSGFAPYHPLVRWGTLVTSLAIIAFALFVRSRSSTNRGIDFSIAAVCFTIASPIAWEHHYGILPTVFAVGVGALLRRGEPQRGLWIAFALAWILTAVRFAGTQALHATSFNFLQSLMYLGALLLVVALHVLRRRVDLDGPAGASA